MIEHFGPVSPAFVLIAAGLVLPFFRGRLQDALFVLAPLLALALVWVLPDGSAGPVDWLGLQLTPLAVDGVARLFGTAFAIAAAVGALYALDQKNVVERASALVYAGSAQGIVFAGDLVTLFAFWEVMAIASTLVILSNGAEKAGLRYALIHVLGGVLLFAGIVAAVAEGGTAIRVMRADSVGHWLILAGVLVNAGAPPLSAWVADAYPRASWSGTVFLSSFTTKAAVLVLIRLFPGEQALLWFGLIMAIYGLIYALLENDIRRLLSYSIVGQVGFMVVAVGIGSPLALAAASVHAFAHILYKALLMMAAGSVMRATGTTRLTELGGIARSLPLTSAAFLVGGFALAAMPFTAGFVSKSAIMQALADDKAALPWFVLTAVSAGSFLYVGLKLPWFALFRPASPRPIILAPRRSMQAAMLLVCTALLLLGCFPNLLVAVAPGISEVRVLTADHILFQFQLLAASGFCFVLLLQLFLPHVAITRDTDWLWRKLPAVVLAKLETIRQALQRLAKGIRQQIELENGGFKPFRSRSLLNAGNWRTGDIALWATALLGLFLLIAAL
ncbi:proton-conducting transporter membrane subunit [Kaistia dalseonensis]|uniref:Multicomponent Na+:H+ antiporter subunit D n=1 Tax=Kaistia dalseonensis TaxID=410840 RepID=A0ABU0HD74_9HYPH|nr:proton-conducting transporter membrane subunit [Kaistia dalseonensis]MCX5497610.1 proton-conducting transporter membrane subunit [Kaistia dalseonensis]MDQ0440252.1 multicomponent Na+:H+ antiporter subunit D [Kaistia dalseonensis]